MCKEKHKYKQESCDTKRVLSRGFEGVCNIEKWWNHLINNSEFPLVNQQCRIYPHKRTIEEDRFIYIRANSIHITDYLMAGIIERVSHKITILVQRFQASYKGSLKGGHGRVSITKQSLFLVSNATSISCRHCE